MTKDVDQALERWQELMRIDLNQAASEFGQLSPEVAVHFAYQTGIPAFRDMIMHLSTDLGAAVLRNLPKVLQERLLKELSSEKNECLRELLSYKPGTAGAIMAKEFLCVSLESNIREATHYLQALPQDRKGKISYIYVTDAMSRLEGVIQVRDLIFYPPEKPVRDILKKPVVQVETAMSQLDVARLLQRHHYLGLPVVDASQKLVGMISADNALKVFEEDAVDDMAKIVGTGAEEIKSRSITKIMRLRLPWLFFNIVSGLLCALISGIFQSRIEAVAVLFLFVPVVLGLSESTGVQGSTIVVRNIALGNLAFKDLGKLFFKEVVVGILIGLICGLTVGCAAGFWKGTYLLGAAVGLPLMLTISISALIGLVLPLLFRHFKIDPAMASGPLVLSICDLQTLFVYFNLASWILMPRS